MPEVPAAISDRVESVRLAIAGALRDRVIGDNAEEKRDAIMNATGPRWFSESSPLYTVHSDSSMFIGGMRALLFQSLHPLAMAGVAQHSDYRGDPWGRLQRTADFVAATSFAPSDVAQRAVDIVVNVHKRVKGTASDGREYSASDPHLLRWVHVAEVDSFMRAHQAYGATPLDTAGYDAYVADMAVIARKLGVPAPPTSVQGLKDQIAQFRPELRGTTESRDAAKYLLLTPPLDLVARVPYSLIAAAAIAILPRWARADLQLPYLPITEQLVVKPIGQIISSTIRWATSGDFVSPAV